MSSTPSTEPKAMQTGFAALAALLPSPGAPPPPSAPSALRAPTDDERTDILRAVLRVATTRLAAVSDGDLREAVSLAISEGRDIVQIGCATDDMEVAGRRFRLRADLRLEGELVQRTILVDGDVSPPRVLHASQCELRALRRPLGA